MINDELTDVYWHNILLVHGTHAVLKKRRVKSF